MTILNYYKLLKIERSADLDTIKKSFRTEIALYHPDKNKTEGAKAHFYLLVEAFDILSHPEKRKAYDHLLSQQENEMGMTTRSTEEKTQSEKQQYKEWQNEAKKKSKSYWSKDLEDLLVLDIFLEAGMSGLFTGIDTMLDGIGDSLDGLGDLLDAF